MRLLESACEQLFLGAPVVSDKDSCDVHGEGFEGPRQFSAYPRRTAGLSKLSLRRIHIYIYISYFYQSAGGLDNGMTMVHK